MSRLVVVHLAVDVNTPQRPRTTTAIEWFADALADNLDQVVIAYQRKPLAPGAPVACEALRYRLYHFPYWGLRFGIGLWPSLRRAAARTIALMEREGVRPDLIHAHKFTFEGIAGWYVARHFGVPLFVSLRGEVETKVFRRKPTLRPMLRRVAADAARLYFVSAWFRPEFHRYVPAAPDKERLLPNIVRNISPTIVPQPPGDVFVSIFALDTWRRKGLRWLLDGFAEALGQQPEMRLDIVGKGSAKAVSRAEAMIAERGLGHAVRLAGALPNAELLKTLPRYRALLLPSLNETFGMVFVEALFAGLPILFTRGTAIDGYLDGLDVGHAVPPRDVGAIAAATLDLWRRSDALRAGITAAAPRLFATFDPETILARYRADVSAAVSGQL